MMTMKWRVRTGSFEATLTWDLSVQPSPWTQSSIWGLAASVPAASVRSAHPKMGEGSWWWPPDGSRKYGLGTCPVHSNDCFSPCKAGAALRLVGMS